MVTYVKKQTNKQANKKNKQANKSIRRKLANCFVFMLT